MRGVVWEGSCNIRLRRSYDDKEVVDEISDMISGFGGGLLLLPVLLCRRNVVSSTLVPSFLSVLVAICLEGVI